MTDKILNWEDGAAAKMLQCSVVTSDVKATAMAHAMDEHAPMLRKSVAHDAALAAELCKAGGALCSEYAALGALAYRQALGPI